MVTRLPLITVVIPTFNRSELLSEAVATVLSQSLTNLQVLVCDNASSDGTAQAISKFRDSRIKYVRHDVNRGMQYNWRYALTSPTTKYVAVLSDDDVFLPHHLESALDALESAPGTGFYACASETFGARNHEPQRPWWMEDASNLTRVPVGHRFAAWLRANPIASPALVIRRSTLDAIDCWGGATWPMSMDLLWWGQLALRDDWLFDPKIGVKYRWHEQNLSHDWYRNRRLVAVEFRYTIRTLANIGIQRGLLTKHGVVEEALAWPANPAATLAVALGAPEAHPGLRGVAQDILAQHPGVRSRGASRHTRLAGAVGGWYLRYADRADRWLANWPPGR